MLNLRKVAITGSLAVGKSTVCRFFEELGAQVMSADAVVHQLLSLDPQISQKVHELLGDKVVVEGAISRAEVAKQVFGDVGKLRALEAIVYPEVRRVLRQRMNESSSPVFVVEVPLLFEAAFENEFDVVIAVTSVVERATHPDAEMRRAQMLSQEEKARRADYVIVNDGTLESLKESVIKIFNQLRST